MKPVRLMTAAIAAVVVSCSGDSGTGVGTVRVALTDAPACGFDQVNITVERVRFHLSDSASETASGWRDLQVNPARRINLLNLNNGVLEELGQMPVPAGRYTQIRLVLRANAGGAFANSVRPIGAAEVALDTPSGVQSGIKLIHPFTVESGRMADVLLDFDACKSVVARGNGTFGLKPVIAVVPRIVSEIVGDIDPALAGVRVSAQIGGNVVRATSPDANGAFKLAYLNSASAPTADVLITADGRASAVVKSVPVAVSGTTRISTSATPITLPISTTRTASGTVTPAAAEPAVRAMQAVGALPLLEIAAVNTNANGGYTLTLPTAAPLLANYATPLPLAFNAQTANAARYTLEASAAGYIAQTAAVDLTNANVTQNFALVQ